MSRNCIITTLYSTTTQSCLPQICQNFALDPEPLILCAINPYVLTLGVRAVRCIHWKNSDAEKEAQDDYQWLHACIEDKFVMIALLLEGHSSAALEVHVNDGRA